MEAMARDVAALMDELRIDSAVICGLSMGCYVAFELIHIFPARVQALVLCGPRAQGPDEAEKASREAQAQRVLHEGIGFAVESISKNLLATATVRDKPNVVARVTEMVLQTDPGGAAAAQRGMAARRDYSNDLPNIAVPSLIIAGREDGVRTPADAEFIERSIKGSQLVVIDDAGHLMNLEQPEVFNETMLDFLRTT
jgi:pimeloyl-ACP methyl ester carboxylesterase